MCGKIFTLRQNIIKFYVLIWVKCHPSVQRKLEGNSGYTTPTPTYDCLWIFMKNKMCTSGIYHTSNKYYSADMAMRTIFFLWQGWDKLTKACYWMFEAAASTAKIEKFTSTTHAELNKTYGGATTTAITIGSGIWVSWCQTTPNYHQLYGIIWIKLPFWLHTITQRPQPLHTTYCVITRSQKYHSKHMHHLRQWNLSIISTQAEI